MRVLIQRVKEAKVFIENEIYSSIEDGLLVFLGIHAYDEIQQIKWIVNKLIHLRVFNDENGKMNRSVMEVGAELLIVSQFTLYGNCMNGRRPDYFQAAPPQIAIPIYEKFIQLLRQEIKQVKTGKFGAHMEISLINDGPVTLFIESENKAE